MNAKLELITAEEIDGCVYRDYLIRYDGELILIYGKVSVYENEFYIKHYRISIPIFSYTYDTDECYEIINITK